MRRADASQLEVGALFFSVGIAGVFTTVLAHSNAPPDTSWWNWWGIGLALSAILSAAGGYVVGSVYTGWSLPPTYATPRLRIRDWKVVDSGHGWVRLRCDVENHGRVDIHDASFNFLVPATVRGVYRSTPRGERAVPGRTPVPADESLRSDESGNPVTSLNWNEQFQYFATGVRMLYFHVEAPPGPLPVFLRVWAESLPDVDDRRTFEVPGLG